MRVLISTSSYVVSSLSTGPFLVFTFSSSSSIGATACPGVQNTDLLALLAWGESVRFGVFPVLYIELSLPSRPAVVPVLAISSCLIGGQAFQITERYWYAPDSVNNLVCTRRLLAILFEITMYDFSESLI